MNTMNAMNAKHIVIVGGGISGLATAYKLTELMRKHSFPLDITVLDSGSQFGGVINTRTDNGFLLEEGPDAFISEKPSGVNLCKRLGIESDLIETQTEFRRSFIVRNGKLCAVPQGLYLVAPGKLSTMITMPLLSWKGKARMAFEPFISKRKDISDESVGSFIRRRLGKEALDRIAQPMVSGIYTADPEKLSLKATLPQLSEMEQKYGSIYRGLKIRARSSDRSISTASGPRYSLFLTLKKGLHTLIDALIKNLTNVTLRGETKVANIDHEGKWKLTLGNGEKIEADVVCLALPAKGAASLLSSCAQHLSKLLGKIPYASVATVNVGFKTEDMPNELKGLGFVAPKVENRGLLGCTFASLKFKDRSPKDTVLLRAFIGGALHTKQYNLDDTQIKEMVLKEFSELLGIKAKPVVISIARYPNAMPQYHLGHLENVQAIESETSKHPGLFLTGNGYRGIGIPDCIKQAESAAEALMSYVLGNQLSS